MEDFAVWLNTLFFPKLSTDHDIIPPKANVKNHIFIAHNFRGYDGRLLYDCLRRNMRSDRPLVPVFQGSRLLTLKIKNGKSSITFIDSLCHIAKPLRNIPAIFGIEDEISKGEFPYMFNTTANRDYVGPLPPLSVFQTHTYDRKRKSDIEEWHALESERVGDKWNMWEELVKYCRMDVTVLRRCMEKYYEFTYTLTKTNVFRSVTIAAFALNVYLSQDLPPDTLFVLDRQSMEFARKALRGGRTDVRWRYVVFTPEEVARGVYATYQDVCSLYPTVQFFDPMPTGKPVKFRFPQGTDLQYLPAPYNRILDVDHVPDSFDQFFCGFICCDIQVTGYLHHPVLVNREHVYGDPTDSTKLVASLHDKHNYHCTSIELWKALRTGCYKITKVYEIHQYTPSTELFKSSIRRWLKVKVTSSGQPRNVDKEEFLRHHLDVLGIELDWDTLEKNVGLREVAKLLLNSLWGKLGQSPDNKQISFAANPKDLHKLRRLEELGLAQAKSFRHHDHHDTAGSSIECNYETHDYRNLSLQTYVPVACFVSAFGRMRLYDELEKLGDRVIYHDTDSIVYQRDPDGYNIPEGKYLGEWEDECPGWKIVEFVGVAPKTYGYVKEDKDGKRDYSNLRCKGFTLNYENAQKIDFDALKSLVTDPNASITVSENRFFWDAYRMHMFTMGVDKVMDGKYNKGHVDKKTFKVYPFGGEKFRPDLYT